MRPIIISLTLLFLAVVLSPAQTISTKGTEFWTGFMENRAGIGNPPADFGFLISADAATSGEISIPLTGFSLPFSVPAGGTVDVRLPKAVFNAEGSGRIEAKGIRITTSAPVSVTALEYRLFFSDASMVLPVERLGSRYLVLAAEDDERISPSAFIVVGVEDGSVIEIIPSTLTEDARPAGKPYTITLNRGEVCQIKGAYDLTGTSVRSTNRRRFALFGGAQAAHDECNSDNHVFDQTPPVDDWEAGYIAIPFAGHGDLLKIVAAEEGTIVRLDCGAEIILGRGEYYRTKLTAPTLITASGPVAVVQQSFGQQCGSVSGSVAVGDPSMLVVPPLSNRVHRRALTTPTYMAPGYSESFSSHYVTLLARTSETGAVKLDGAAVPGFAPVPAEPEYSWVSLPLTAGEHVVESEDGIVAYAYGFGQYDGYTYGLGVDTLVEDGGLLSFTFTPSRFSFSLAACGPASPGGGICPGTTVAFTGSASPDLTGWRWDFGDGSFAEGKDATHAYAGTGEYRVRFIARGPGCRWYSVSRRLGIADCAPGRPMLRVEPNPLSDAPSVSWVAGSEGMVTIDLFGADGRLVARLYRGHEPAGPGGARLDLEGIPAGVYILRMEAGDDVVAEPVVKRE